MVVVAAVAAFVAIAFFKRAVPADHCRRGARRLLLSCAAPALGRAAADSGQRDIPAAVARRCAGCCEGGRSSGARSGSARSRSSRRLSGRGHVFVQEALFFSKVAVVTFGGAYAVLAYVAQQAVEELALAQPDEMLTGLGLAETTPGPLILVLVFVGFLAGARGETGLDPLARRHDRRVRSRCG